MESTMDSQSSIQSEDANGDGKEDEALLLRAQELMAKITSSQTNPSSNVLHALASILEKQESRYLQEFGYSSSNNFRSSHIIGKLGNLIQENDDFFELISSKFLLENSYPDSIRTAAARLLLSCSVTWVFPHVFEDAVVENIKHWILDDIVKVSVDNCSDGLDRNKPTDSNMLRTYGTGLLASCLAGAGGGQVVEDVLTSGLPAKLMRYLRTRVLGETNTNKKDASYSTEGKHASGATYVRGREDNRGRLKQVLDDIHLDGQRIGNEGLLDDQGATDALEEVVATCQADVDGVGQIIEGRQQSEDLLDGNTQFSDRDGTSRSTRDEDANENTRDFSSRHRANMGLTRIKGRGGNNDRVKENERILMSSRTGLQLGQGRNVRDGNQLKNSETTRAPDVKNYSSEMGADSFVRERESDDDYFGECKIGSKDISDLIKRAMKAAEAEARAANASAEAIEAACDAAAELVKTAALDALKSTNDEEASVLAASNAASTVVDAAITTEILRSSSFVDEDPMISKAGAPETDEGLEELFFLDNESLALMREKYCIKCLDILGEYVEVLGPILHEKGVDVCLAFLQRSAKHIEASEILILVPDMLKLICALAAHRKFAALFVDRGGMQKLLTVQRVSQTFYGLSLCLLTIGSLQGIMERVCALPSDVVHQIVELALQLLECPEDDMAKKNAAIFFTASFVFRAVLESFDAQEGLRKLLNLLHSAASARSGVHSGAIGSILRNDRSPAEVLTALEKQRAYHSCIALRQYFRAHLLLLVDSLRPNKSQRSVARNIPSARTAYKPLDISNEAMDAIFLLIQRDRKLGPAFVRVRWGAVDKFLGCNGHVTMLELCQAPPADRYLHDLAQYALGVLHLVTLVPYSRKLIVSATLSSEHAGIAVILDAASGAAYVDPEVIHPALNVLVNLVCPPPSISYKPPVLVQGQQSVSVQILNGPASEGMEKHAEGNIIDQTAPLAIKNVSGEHTGEPNLVERSSPAVLGNVVGAVPTIASGVVGNRRINLGPRVGCAGVAAQLEKGYHEAREAVRVNNGIKVLLHLLQPRIFTPPAALDCLRALACRVLLGLARDDTIANILTKLQVGKKLSELIRDTGSQVPGIGTDQGRWRVELAQVAIELIAIVTNSGRASTLAATDAATPTLRRIERAAIAAATPITYHHRELLFLIHEHLQASGLITSAASLLKEAQLTPFPSVGAPLPILNQITVQEKSSIQLQWPSGHTSCGFLSNTSKVTPRDEGLGLTSDSTLSCSRKKPLTFSSKLTSQAKNQLPSTTDKIFSALKNPSISDSLLVKTTAVSPLKRKRIESKDTTFSSPVKRLTTGELGFQTPVCLTPNSPLKIGPSIDATGLFVTSSTQQIPYAQPSPRNNTKCHSSPIGQTTSSGFQLGEQQASNTDRVTLDALVVQYLKHQHRQCPAPITTLPPLSLLHPHVCPEPSQSIDAPTNVTARLSMRELRNQYDGAHGHCRDRQFVYSRFRPWRTCRDGTSLLTCLAFLGDSSQIVTGSHSGELKIFESDSGNVIESHMCHQSPVTLVESAMCGGTRLVLSSSTRDVGLWNPSSLSGGPLHLFEGCKAARLGNSAALFAALSSESSRREVLLYDIQTYALERKLTDGSSLGPSGPVRGHTQSLLHFSPSDTMLLWNGVLWDRRSSGPVRRFDQFTDYGGGGFHPAGNEVIINSEVWDLRKFKLLRSVPSLEQTVITFSAGGDVIYAILRRNVEDITSAVNTRRSKHPLFAAFRTIDAINYSDISTIPIDRCALDFAAEPMDSFVGVVAMDDPEQLFSSARLFEVGRRRPTDDDSDPDDGAQTDEEEEDDDDDEDSEAEEDQLMLSPDSDGDESDDGADVIDGDDSDEEMDGDVDLATDDAGFGDGASILEIGAEGEDDEDDSEVESLSSDDEGRYVDFGF